MKKRLFCMILALALCLSFALPAFADNTGLVRDGADLLTDRAEQELELELERISGAYGADVLVVTLESTEGFEVDFFTEKYYDTFIGADHDGVMLLITMREREYRILSNGFGNVAVNRSEIDEICSNIEPYLRDGDYAAAFRIFARDCEYQLNGEVNGFPFAFGTTLLISLVVGFVVAGIVVLILVFQLRSTGRRHTAQGYARKGSFRLTGSHDIYLYRNVSRRRRQTESSGGSRSGGGRSGGGGGRSMGGGRF